MSTGLYAFITTYTLINLVGGLILHLLLSFSNDDNLTIKGFWGIIWNLYLLNDINKCGKIIIEILYTITFLPIIICGYLLFSIIAIVYFLIVKPFIFIFKKRGKPNGEESK